MWSRGFCGQVSVLWTTWALAAGVVGEEVYAGDRGADGRVRIGTLGLVVGLSQSRLFLVRTSPLL